MEAITSMTIEPAPNAARSALSPDMDLTTPATIIWSPPPAELVDIYISTPSSPFWGVIISSPFKIFRLASSSTSITAFNTPRVTSSNGASTVVGASPR